MRLSHVLPLRPEPKIQTTFAGSTPPARRPPTPLERRRWRRFFPRWYARETTGGRLAADLTLCQAPRANPRKASSTRGPNYRFLPRPIAFQVPEMVAHRRPFE